MHVQTHLLCGWCIGNGFRFTPRERLLCMLVSAAPDLDGLGILYSQDAYWNWHHVLAHNLLFALTISGVFAALSTHRMKAFVLYFLLVHLHFIMDLLGSGPGVGDFLFLATWPLDGKQPVFMAALFLAEYVLCIDLFSLGVGDRDLRWPHTARSVDAGSRC